MNIYMRRNKIILKIFAVAFATLFYRCPLTARPLLKWPRSGCEITPHRLACRHNESKLDIVHRGIAHDFFSWTGVAIHLRACGHFTEATEFAIRRLEGNQNRRFPISVFASNEKFEGHNTSRRMQRPCLHRWRQTRLGGRRLILKISSVKTASERSHVSRRCT